MGADGSGSWGTSMTLNASVFFVLFLLKLFHKSRARFVQSLIDTGHLFLKGSLTGQFRRVLFTFYPFDLF
jgi:hypothetical protein